MFKESVEIEFRVSESLVLALQLFPEKLFMFVANI